MTAAIAVQVRIADINVGDRRREDLGDIAALATSIKRHGLFHPIIVDPSNRLVAGERRLRACESLGWEWIPARQWESLTEAELREIEIEENLRRKDLTSFELAKEMVRQAEKVAPLISGNLPEKDVRGRKPNYEAPKADIAEALGTDDRTLRRAEQHVATAETYPVFQKPDWKQYHVLEARTHLEKLPDEQRPEAVALIDEPGTPPQIANKILSNLANMPEPERAEIIQLHRSADSRDRSLAKTKAAEMPPMPDPRASVLYEMRLRLNKFVKEFPDDVFTPRLRDLLNEMRLLESDILNGRESA